MVGDISEPDLMAQCEMVTNNLFGHVHRNETNLIQLVSVKVVFID